MVDLPGLALMLFGECVRGWMPPPKPEVWPIPSRDVE